MWPPYTFSVPRDLTIYFIGNRELRIYFHVNRDSAYCLFLGIDPFILVGTILGQIKFSGIYFKQNCGFPLNLAGTVLNYFILP